MFKKIKEIRKMFKGVKSMIVIRCDNCESINTKLYNDTLESKVIEIDGEKMKKVSYMVSCNNCSTVGMIEESWYIKKEIANSGK